jgi:hypothetical protein
MAARDHVIDLWITGWELSAMVQRLRDYCGYKRLVPSTLFRAATQSPAPLPDAIYCLHPEIPRRSSYDQHEDRSAKEVPFPKRKLTISTYEMPDGKLDQ